MLDIIFSQASESSGAITLASLGVIVAIIIGAWRGIRTANVQVEAERVRESNRECEARCKGKDDQIWLLQQQLRASEAKAAVWQTRCESLGWPDTPNQKPSQTRTETE